MDFASLSPSVNIHRPTEQAFAVEEDEDSEEMFAMMDRTGGFGAGDPAIVVADVCPRKKDGI